VSQEREKAARARSAALVWRAFSFRSFKFVCKQKTEKESSALEGRKTRPRKKEKAEERGKLKNG
jgi:hypothetical protein